MIRFMLLVAVIFFLWACAPCKHCSLKNNYLKSVDTSKPYKIDGKYCIVNTNDTLLENGLSIIKLNVFDRRNGEFIEDGVAWFYSETDTVQLLLERGNGYKKLSPGNYTIGIAISNNGLLGFNTIKKLEIKKNTQTKINIFLGSSLQW